MEQEKKEKALLIGLLVAVVVFSAGQQHVLLRSMKILENDINGSKETLAQLNRGLKQAEVFHQKYLSLFNDIENIKYSPKIEPTGETNQEGWKEPQNWTYVQEGMDLQTLKNILGIPTSMEKKGNNSKLYYEGFSKEYGDIMGQVHLGHEKVTIINYPNFGFKKPQEAAPAGSKVSAPKNFPKNKTKTKIRKQ